MKKKWYEDPESEERRHARSILLQHAWQAYQSGKSYYEWLDKEDPDLLQVFSEKELESISQIVWARKGAVFFRR